MVICLSFSPFLLSLSITSRYILKKRIRGKISKTSMKLKFRLKYIMCFVITKNLIWKVKNWFYADRHFTQTKIEHYYKAKANTDTSVIFNQFSSEFHSCVPFKNLNPSPINIHQRQQEENDLCYVIQ